MKRLLGTVAEGTIVKMYENGSYADFIVARHNYGRSRNGTGHTMMVRKSILPEKRDWGSALRGSGTSTSLNWYSDSELAGWLANTYRTWLDPGVQARVKPLKVYSAYSKRTVSFKVPDSSDFSTGYGADRNWGFSDETLTSLRNAYTDAFWLTDTDRHSYTSNDDPPVEEEYGRAACMIFDHFPDGWRTWYSEQPSTCGVLPCFLLYDDICLGDDGVLRANRAPEITSLYFGMNSIHGKKTPFKLPYSVHDEDGDAITVTEKLDGTIVRTYTAEDGATNLFTVTQEMLDGIDGTTDHELTVTASDDVSGSTKKYLFHKVVGSGYVVYIGKIAGTADGTGYYWTEREVLHDAGNEEMPIVLDPELTLEKNELGSFTFTIPAINPYYDKIGLKTTVISVEEDGAEIFMGYVTEMNKQFSLDIEVTCEGELGYLQDRDCIIEEKVYSPAELVRLAVSTDTSDKQFAKEGKAFNLGEVTKQKTGTGKDDKESKSVSDCWSAVKTNLADKFGGYLRLRKIVKMENDILVYHRYLDYLDTVPDQTDQVIQFGVNLLDVSYYLKTNQLVNSVRVIGYETTGWFIFTSTNQIEVTVNNDESIKKYGLCQRILIVDGTSSSRDSLRQKGLEELTKYTEQFTGSITMNASDLADIGVDVDRLAFLKNARAISEAHGLANWMLCVKEVIPLDALEEKEFTFGESCSTLSALQASNFGTAGKAWDMIQSTVKYVKNGG